MGQCSHLPNDEILEVAIVRYYWLRVGGAGVSVAPSHCCLQKHQAMPIEAPT
jgi:hypothetical protein